MRLVLRGTFDSTAPHRDMAKTQKPQSGAVPRSWRACSKHALNIDKLLSLCSKHALNIDKDKLLSL